MTDESQVLARIEQQLNILIRLAALRICDDSKSLSDLAFKLHKAGLQPKEIAPLCDSTPNAVSVALVKAKKAAKSGKGKKGE